MGNGLSCRGTGNGINLGYACGWGRTSECTGNNLQPMNDSVFGRWSRDGKIGMKEFHCIGDGLALSVCIDKLEAAVGIHGWTNVKAILGTKIPRASGRTTNWA